MEDMGMLVRANVDPHLIRIFRMPMPDGQFCSGGGNPRTFIEVDWFKDSLMDPVGWTMFSEDPTGDDPNNYSITTEKGRAFIEEYLRATQYWDDSFAYLVVSPKSAFTINYGQG